MDVLQALAVLVVCGAVIALACWIVDRHGAQPLDEAQPLDGDWLWPERQS